MFLEIATHGRVVRRALASTPHNGLAIVFGRGVAVFGVPCWPPRRHTGDVAVPDRLAAVLQLDSTAPTPEGHLCTTCGGPGRIWVMYLRGCVRSARDRLRSGQSPGDGSGDATAVQGFDDDEQLMIGVTAAASAGVYFHRGYIDPGLGMPFVLGVLLGSMLGRAC